MPKEEYLTFNIRDEYAVWQRIQPEFVSRLPLRNLIWKGGLSQAPRFVEQLNIKISTSDIDSSHDALPMATAMQASPLLNIYLVEADADADTYKAVIKPRIKNWVAKASQRKGEEWLVVYLPNEAEIQRMATTSKFLNMRQSVFDRIKSDFQTKKDAEHVVSLRPDAIESWNSAFLVIRDRVVQALEDRVAHFVDEIRRMDANRMLPGWNYCKFFILKEGLVNLYRLMGLNEEALAQYDELEAVFFQLLDSHLLSWFTQFGGGEPGDDFTDLLDMRKKPYRQQMVDNTITMFDFRVYLFGRQCELLIELERYEEFVERAQRFIATFSKAMRAPGTGLSLAFVTSWTYSTCQNIVEICEGVHISQAPTDRGHLRTNASAATRMLAASKAEFLTSARRQLDILGTLYDRLPPTYLKRSNTYTQVPSPLLRTPVETGDESSEAEGTPAPSSFKEGRRRRESFGTALRRYRRYVDDSIKITNPVLTEALSADDRFDQIYIKTCEQATQYYMECGRKRFSQVLRGDIAQLHVCRERWQEAAKILRPLISPLDFGALGTMDVHLIERLAICERHLGNTQACLEYLLCLMANAQFLDRDSCEMYTDMFVELSVSLSDIYRVESPSLFKPKDAETVDLDTTLGVAISLLSMAPKRMAASKIEATLVSGTGQQQLEVVFDTANTTIEPGENKIQLTTDSISCPGRFVVRSVDVHIGNIMLSYTMSTPNAKRFVRLNEHPTNPLIAVRPAREADACGPSAVRLSVASRETQIDPGMSVRLFSSAGVPLLDSSCRSSQYEIVDGAIVVASEVRAGQTIEIDVVLGELYATDKVSVYAEFRTQGEERMVLDSDIVEFTPALDVSAFVGTLRSKHVLQICARCCSNSPVLLVSSSTSSEPQSTGGWGGDAAATKARGFMRHGEQATSVHEYPASTREVSMEAEFAYATLFDRIARVVGSGIAKVAPRHALAQHQRYLGRVVLAHIRNTLDVEATLQGERLVCQPLGSLWVAASVDGTAALRAATRRMLDELSAILVNADISTLSDGGNGDDVRVVRVSFSQTIEMKFAAVTVSLDSGKYCHVYEPSPLTVQVRVVDNGEGSQDTGVERKLWVRLAPREASWLVSGATSREISVRGNESVDLHYTLVPLEVGYLQPPEVICHERSVNNATSDQPQEDGGHGGGGGNYRRLHTWVSYAQASPCVLTNSSVPSVYTVPVVVEDSQADLISPARGSFAAAAT